MKIAIVTFEGFNEIDSFVALNVLNRVQQADWQAYIVSPTERVTSMNGVMVQSQQPFSFVNQADAVLIGSGRYTRNVINDDRIMSLFQLDPERQQIGSQCSGALVLAKLGLLNQIPACTDTTTRPYLEAAGVTVLEQPLSISGNIATAGGCLSAQYLAAWLIASRLGTAAAAAAISYVAPVGEKEEYIARMLSVLGAMYSSAAKP